ncbi:hypothetical protein CHO01_13650 [Cellulomonas hominis]|uniref:Vacuolar-type H+-ATPase subunit I/STV1 n=2 Tax=Cellulomonas hominis TaxID=156981 RepID=A0A511FAF8_9CELL|nr:hypothetical protein [Cellulomonas hominis]MBB5471419.1 vacuolar-type H+-ATPase subunit I/STV1 [Cellulomonas hominis]GEL46249.1 hypothetical protein CHO01_13650 [Cellulomonas hominis]
MSERRSSLAVGLTVFAGTIMIMIGVMHVFQGLVALVNDTFYVAGEEWVFQFDVTTWGWVHLILGALVALAGFFVFSGAVWARTIGVIVAVVSGVATFAWLPYYPLWGLVVIALDVFVIWALTAHGREVA